METTPSPSALLDAIQSGITDAYEALTELADAGDSRAAILRDALRVAFAVSTVSRPCAPAPLLAFTTQTVVGAVDAMREQEERDYAPSVCGDMDGAHADREVA